MVFVPYTSIPTLMGLACHEAKYATTATQKEFWSFWKELFKPKQKKPHGLTNSNPEESALPANERTTLFQERYKNVWTYFQNLEKEEQAVTEQDKLFSFCQPETIRPILQLHIV